MTAPLPESENVTDLDAWIAARLDTDDEGDPAWRSTINPAGMARAVGSANPTRYVQIKMTAEFAHELSQVALERGLSRESLIRVALARLVADARGLDPDEVLLGMPPRRKGR
jgi:hypothetical protein